MSDAWSATTNWETVCKRNAGRRRYNGRRTNRKRWRRLQILERLQAEPAAWGFQAALAREFGVSRATICRDLAAVRRFDWR
jgi:hypothetical protein